MEERLPPPPTPREFVNGETFRYLGRQYRLKRHRANDGDARVRVVEGRLVVPVDPRADAANQVRDRLVAWYRERAQARLPERVETRSAKLGLHPASVLIRDQQKRWGSADTKGNVRFNWRIIQAPPKLIDYVVAHELVHLAYAEHTQDFWATLGRAVPDYEARREALRRLGTSVVW